MIVVRFVFRRVFPLLPHRVELGRFLQRLLRARQASSAVSKGHIHSLLAYFRRRLDIRVVRCTKHLGGSVVRDTERTRAGVIIVF